MATISDYNLQEDGNFAALMLEVPFDSLLNDAKDALPIPMPLNYIMKDHYNDLAMIKDINSPLLILGGSNDPTVPVNLAKNLFNHASEPKEMIIYEGGMHSDLQNFRNYQDILSWLNKGK